jgi:hypothetical protein
LNNVTAYILRVGSAGFAGHINVNCNISPVNIDVQSLITTGTDTIESRPPPTWRSKWPNDLANL